MADLDSTLGRSLADAVAAAIEITAVTSAAQITRCI
jgi:hypothetical protein